MHTVRSCCCGCTLRTGTLILLWIVMVCGLLNFNVSLSTYAQGKVPASILADFLIRAIYISISGAGIYGINKEKPSFLIPFLILQVHGLMGTLIIMILLLFAGTAILISMIPETDKDLKLDGVGIITLVEFLLLGLEALSYYFFVVVLSCYRELSGKLPPSAKCIRPSM